MRIYNYKNGTARRVAVEDGKELVDPIDALGGQRSALRSAPPRRAHHRISMQA